MIESIKWYRSFRAAGPTTVQLYGVLQGEDVMFPSRPSNLSSAIGLSRGARGAAVDDLQNFLRRFGYLHVTAAGDLFATIRAVSSLMF